MKYFIGVMSGTSLDGIDIVIVSFTNDTTKVIAHSTTAYPSDIRHQIELLVNSEQVSLHTFCQLDIQIAKAYSSAIMALLKENNILSRHIYAIGSHGQTIKHNPNIEHAYTLQIGDPNTLSALTNITVVADFRRKDVALGGQGAPLAPAFHQYAFQSNTKNRAIINIGGIANITALPTLQSGEKILGFDTGPGNTLLDHLCQKHFKINYDKNGAIAASGKVNAALLNHIINSEPFFSLAPAKSTGTDYFNLKWFEHHVKLANISISPEDQLATLTDLTALTISMAIKNLSTHIDEIYYCGGGQHNTTLMQRLQFHTKLDSNSTEQLNISPDWVEAMAFAWFAKNTLDNQPSNIPSVTAASEKTILGGIFKA